MKLFEVVGKETYKRDLTEDQAIELALAHCKDALKTLDAPIVRGMTEFKNGYGLIQGEAGARRSAHTTNYYTTILDASLPPEYPRRSASIICANWKNYSAAEAYAEEDVYIILPYDGVKIGICPEGDLWAVEIKIGKHTETIVSWNEEYEALGIHESATFPEIVQSLTNAKAEDPEIAFDVKPGKVKETLIAAYAKPFKLATTATPRKYNDGVYRELWIGGKCVAISEKNFKSFRNKL